MEDTTEIDGADIEKKVGFHSTKHFQDSLTTKNYSKAPALSPSRNFLSVRNVNENLSYKTITESWRHRFNKSGTYDLICTTFCPGLVMAYLKSKTKREESYSFTNHQIFSGFKYGKSGMNFCLQTTCLCCVGYPFSPGLVYVLLNQRKRYRIIYNHDAVSQCPDIAFENTSVCCLWPCALLQQMDFLESRNAENLLRFDWEENDDVISDLLRPLPARVDKRVMLFGPTGCGKSLFAKKLTGAANAQDTDISSGTVVQVGVKCYSMSEEHVTFVEVWDVPAMAASSHQVELAIMDTTAVVFMFDSSNILGTSFAQTKNIYSSTVSSLSQEKKKFLVAAKIDQLSVNAFDDTSSNGYGSVSELSQHQASLTDARRFILEEAQAWACSEGLTYLEVSSLHNIGTIKALRKFVEDE